MKGRILLAALAAALVTVGGVASSATAVPSPGLKITPQMQLQFGTVPIGTQVVKPVEILNRTNEWMYYDGATWPNLQYPGAGVQPYPLGFWNVSGSGPNFPCWFIAPKSSCTLNFDWQPFEPGTHTATFMMKYLGLDTGTVYESNEITFIGTGY